MNNPKSLTIEYAKESGEALSHLLADGNAPVFDMTEVTDLDLSGVQLLVGMIKKASVEKKTLRFTGTVCPEIRARLAFTGICAEECSTGEELEQALRSLC